MFVVQSHRRSFSAILVLTILTILPPGSLAGPFVGRETGRTIPRFVSLGASRANVRVGPGLEYRVDWTFVRGGLPLEIIHEFGNWRRIRDWTGDVGWIHHALLSGIRSAIVRPWQPEGLIDLYAREGDPADLRARVEPLTVVRLHSCDGRWCSVSVRDVEGVVRQSALWGVYPGEHIAE